MSTSEKKYPQTKYTKKYFEKMIRINLVVDPELKPAIDKVKENFGSVNAGMQQLLRLYYAEPDKR